MAKIKLELEPFDIIQGFGRDKRIAYSKVMQQPAAKRDFATRVIDRIVQRTQEENIDKNSRPFKKYSKEYTKSLQFRSFGKSTSDVNLRLTGDMLSNLSVLKVGRITVTIGFPDKQQNDKASGHVLGDGTVPRRDFMGLPLSEQKKILLDVIRDNADGLDSEVLEAFVRRETTSALDTLDIEEPGDE